MDWEEYKVLLIFLERVEKSLEESCNPKDVEAIVNAKDYFGMSSPTEFIGESIVALRGLIGNGKVKPDVEAQIGDWVSKLEVAMESSGMKLS